MTNIESTPKSGQATIFDLRIVFCCAEIWLARLEQLKEYEPLGSVELKSIWLMGL